MQQPGDARPGAELSPTDDLQVVSSWPTLPLRSAQALEGLLAGNARFRSGHSSHPHESRAWRRELEEGQHPLAIFFGCVDSRVAVEVVLDQGLGDLFTARSAGHVLDDAVLGSLELGVHQLGIPLLMVLGHERCGAVAAALRVILDGDPAPGAIRVLVEAIRPAVDATCEIDDADVRLTAAVRHHTRATVGTLLARSDLLRSAVDAGELGIVGAWYSLHTGEIQPA